MPEIIINGDRIHYIRGSRIDTARTTILMIHGAGQRIATWRYQFEAFNDHPTYNIIAPDLPGHGISEGSGFKDIAVYKGFIKEFSEALGVNDLVLMGHSMGGGVAMLFALDHPERVRACILPGTGARLRVSGESLKAVKNDYRAFCELSPGRMLGPGASEELRDEFKADLLDTSPDVCYWDLVACDEFDIMVRVHEIKAPACIISGEFDILTPPKYGEYLEKSMDGSSYHLIKGAGHFMMLEKPEEFNDIFAAFLITIEA
jgi:pimeloyl-ACP methyl ester carboxylesterase